MDLFQAHANFNVKSARQNRIKVLTIQIAFKPTVQLTFQIEWSILLDEWVRRVRTISVLSFELKQKFSVWALRLLERSLLSGCHFSKPNSLLFKLLFFRNYQHAFLSHHLQIDQKCLHTHSFEVLKTLVDVWFSPESVKMTQINNNKIQNSMHAHFNVIFHSAAIF